jgi:hypothetical protein
MRKHITEKATFTFKELGNNYSDFDVVYNDNENIRYVMSLPLSYIKSYLRMDNNEYNNREFRKAILLMV